MYSKKLELSQNSGTTPAPTPGFAADVTVFDPKTVKACAPEWAEDYPAATKRLIQRSEGVHYTIVNGKVIYDDGKLSGEMAGKVLRGTAYHTGH